MVAGERARPARRGFPGEGFRMKVRLALLYMVAPLSVAQAAPAALAQYQDANGQVIDAATFRKLAPGHSFIISESADGKTPTFKVMNIAEAAANETIEHDPRLDPRPSRAAGQAKPVDGAPATTGKP
jgi:hypothetical protein